MRQKSFCRAGLAATLAVGALFAGCGGDDAVEGGTAIEGGSDADPQEVIDATFSNDAEVTSGVINLSFEASGEGEGGTGSASFTLEGPFDSGDDPTQVPSLDLSASLTATGGGQDIDFSGGLTTTPESAFITYNDQSYQIDESTFSFISSAFAQSAQAQETSAADSAAVLEQLGIDPGTWLTDVTNEGTADVGGTETIHISGTADVGQILEDFTALSESAPIPGVTTTVPSADELALVEEAITEATIDLYTGAEDSVLRKLDLTLGIEATEELAEEAGVATGSLSFSVELTELNEDQEIETPDDAAPLSELTDQLGLDLGALGALGGLGGTGFEGLDETGSIPDAGSTDSGSLGSTETDALLDCIAQATTPEEIEACSTQ